MSLGCAGAMAAVLVQLCVVLPAQAEEAFVRKSGLWEVKTSVANSNAPARLVRQCIDAATDQMLQSSAGPVSAAACSKRNVRRSADQLVQDFSCTVAGKPATAHGVVTESSDSAYAMTVTAEGEAIPEGKMTMTMEGKWLGPCAADQKPGDVIMPNGVKINILDMQKRSAPSADPSAR